MEKKNSALTYAEIYGQADSFAAINASMPAIRETLDKVFAEKYDELIFTGCGTSLYLAQTAAHIFSEFNDVPARAVCCSELYFFPRVYVKPGRRVLILPITRKSYTTEVRMAIDKVRALPELKTLAITCDADSRLYNDAFVLSPETAEDSVIMTRSFTSMVYLACVLSLHAAGRKADLDSLADYPDHARRLLKATDDLARTIVAEHPELDLYITLGQGEYYGVANECMNKMKEMGIANSEAYYSLEYRHGPMSLVDDKTLLVTLAHPDTLKEDAALLSQMNSYGGVTVAIGEGVTAAMPDAAYHLELGCGYDAARSAALIGLIGQFLGYYIAEKKGIDADSPRHLTQAIVLNDK